MPNIVTTNDPAIKPSSGSTPSQGAAQQVGQEQEEGSIVGSGAGKSQAPGTFGVQGKAIDRKV